MSKPNKQRAAVPLATESAATAIRQFLVDGKTKAALDRAKEIYKQSPSPETESLLIESYLARIAALAAQNLELEAKSLADLVRQRFPAARARLDQPSAVPAKDTLNSALALLIDPATSPEQRVRIENRIRTEAADLTALAHTTALPPEHPLRVAAAALDRAFRAVTSGPVTEEQIALPEVSHRSPLAPWKMLVRAIAAFYRQDEEACRRAIAAIPQNSAAARAIPPLEALLNSEARLKLKPAAAQLVRQVRGKPGELLDALRAFDDAIDSHQVKQIQIQIRAVMAALKGTPRDLFERIRSRMLVRCMLAGLDVDTATAATGPPFEDDFEHKRWFALALEQIRDPGAILSAVMAWLEVGQIGMEDGMFAEKSIEAGAILLHAVALLDELPAEFAEEIARQAKRSKSPTPGTIYAEACRADPHPEAFEQWLNWAVRMDDSAGAEQAAEAWRRALPHDARPLVHLALSAERRSAFQKGLDLIDRAIEIDGVNPEVRRARLRLLVSAILRHLRQRKTRLARKGIGQLEEFPDTRRGDRPALLAALRCVCDAMDEHPEEAAAGRTEVAGLLDGILAASVLFFSILADINGHGIPALGSPKVASAEDADTAAASLARACALCADVNLEPNCPLELQTLALRRLTEGKGAAISPAHLLAFGEAAIGWANSRLAYAVTVEGLTRGGAHQARFLLMRSKVIPRELHGRREQCLRAAAALARRDRDQEMIRAVAKERSDYGFDFFEEPEDQIPPETLEEMLKLERFNTSFPIFGDPGDVIDELEFDEDDEDEFNDPFPPGMLESFLDHAARSPFKPGSRKKGGRQDASDNYDLPF